MTATLDWSFKAYTTLFSKKIEVARSYIYMLSNDKDRAISHEDESASSWWGGYIIILYSSVYIYLLSRPNVN